MKERVPKAVQGVQKDAAGGRGLRHRVVDSQQDDGRDCIQDPDHDQAHGPAPDFDHEARDRRPDHGRHDVAVRIDRVGALPQVTRDQDGQQAA